MGDMPPPDLDRGCLLTLGLIVLLFFSSAVGVGEVASWFWPTIDLIGRLVVGIVWVVVTIASFIKLAE